MGITGLLPIVRPIMKRYPIRRYQKTRVGIDGHVWLHGVVAAVAPILFEDGWTDKHVPLLIKKAESLKKHGITPVFVFDGDSSVSKEKTNRARREQREKARQEALFWMKRGDQSRARELMRRSVSITPEILGVTLSGLRAAGFEYIVSPYEADPQLVLLERIGYIDWIMTIDSDLIAYGARRVLYNFDGTTVEEYVSKNLVLARDRVFAENILDLSILNGCDYLDSIRGVGLRVAHRGLQQHGNVRAFVDSLCKAGKAVPENYLEDFGRARLTFLHSIVYNPRTKRRQHLSGETNLSFDFLGTLEDIPLVFKNKLGDDIYVKRHYVPPSTLIFDEGIQSSEIHCASDIFGESETCCEN